MSGPWCKERQFNPVEVEDDTWQLLQYDWAGENAEANNGAEEMASRAREAKAFEDDDMIVEQMVDE